MDERDLATGVPFSSHKKKEFMICMLTHSELFMMLTLVSLINFILTTAPIIETTLTLS